MGMCSNNQNLIKAKPGWLLLTCLLALACVYPAAAQNKLKLTDFHFGYYDQKTVGKTLDYQSFTNGSDLKDILPNQAIYENKLRQTNLKQTGLNFGFTFNIVNAETEESSPHYFTLGIRNGFLLSDLGPETSNQLFALETEAANEVNYSLRLKAEGFGLSTGYKYRLVNKGRFKAYAGASLLYEIPVSQKLNVVPDFTSGSTDTTSSTINHTYFLKKTGSLFLLPQAGFDIRVTKYTVLAFNYQMGIARHKFESTSLISRSRTVQMTLKFQI